MKTTYLIVTGGIIILAMIVIIVPAKNTIFPESVNDLHSTQISKENVNQKKILIGTWVKEHTSQEGGDYPGDKNWNLTVIFNSDGRFIWNSKRKEQDGKIIDESLSGTYTIEKGFLISYHFDKPSNQALKKIPILFAFWPNQLLGQQTFRFVDDYLFLVHDGGKIWIYLKKP